MTSQLKANSTLVSTLVSAFIVFTSLASFPGNAHLMVAQHGTLNVQKTGVFTVLSVPVSAFDNIDDNSDGKLSMAELERHKKAIAQQVETKVSLMVNQQNHVLQGTLLSPVHSHGNPNGPVSQLIVMGRFAVEDIDADLSLNYQLFGIKASEQKMEIVAKHYNTDQQSEFALTPLRHSSSLF